ncbi:TOBE domain-containing protein [Halomonas piscis]|uniref:TOBE domain-containing protein n=1 Tax=Halomonas piscis TaxID=3031727 RepID=A0ABY9YY84_9GAMM|nr:TOBE domain-containing protein [Halomonas piscis]WNK19824.1 TOBE domain-containing protein [Halomonas piscis]
MADSSAHQHIAPLTLDGQLWLNAGEQRLASHGRMRLLAAIAETGSISAAARAIKMSYKAAWDAVDQMNNLAGEALVERSAGGRGGGTTRLTAAGSRLIEDFNALDALHRDFVERLNREAESLSDNLPLLRKLSMKSSARNQFSGTVSAIRQGAVNDEVELTLPGGQRLVAVITQESAASLGLAEGSEAFALIKASSVIIAVETEGTSLSARNCLAGTVERLVPGAVNSEVVLALDGGERLAAIITRESVEHLGLAEGSPASALFKASSVIVGTR